MYKIASMTATAFFMGSISYAANADSLSSAVASDTMASDGAVEVISTHAIVGFGSAKYPANFSHFDYVNPNAPKGGRATYSAIGSYDNFNRYASRGEPAKGADALYDTLFSASLDEVDSYYPLIATGARYAADFSWMEIDLNPAAVFHDGDPIDADDVAFSFDKFMTQGVSQYRSYYSMVKSVEALSPTLVRIEMDEPNREKLFALARGMTVLPQHYWQDRDFSEPLVEPPLGSSAYRVGDYDMGSSITYQRVADYWAADLPVNRGLDNLDEVRYDYYRDTNVALEAFKAGEFDFTLESQAKNWAEAYTGPNIDAGYIVREEIPHSVPASMTGFVFNTQRPQFADPKVREALSLLMDFEWMNKTLFYGQYTRTLSYFQNSDYQARGTPSDAELAYLEPLRDKVPARVFTEPYALPITDGSGRNRRQVRQALSLLKDAGWELVDGKLSHRDGSVFSFELLAFSPTTERIAAPLQKNFERVGIEMSIRIIDTAQYTKRVRDRDFDMLSRPFPAVRYPSTSLSIIYHSDFIDSSWNMPGIDNPAVDALVDEILANQAHPDTLIPLGRALDRVLQWNFYAIPQWHLSKYRVAYWDKFDRPDVIPTYVLGRDTWWIDPDKAAKLPESRR